MSRENVYIVDIKRTAIAKFLGSLKDVKATQLPQPIIKYFLTKYPQLKKIDEVIMGNVLSAGLGMNPARIISLRSGLSEKTPATTLNFVCGSGLRSIIEATKSILLQDAQVILAGGSESMSNAPYLLNRNDAKFGNRQLTDTIYEDGLYCQFVNSVMGLTAEYIAKKYSISREKQDKFSLKSHQKAILSIKKNLFRDEVIDFPLESTNFSLDEQPRSDTSLIRLSKLKTIFKKNGTVTAGNSSSLNDGAAMAIIVSESALKKYRLKPLVRLVDYNYLGTNPNYMGIAPYYSIGKLLKKNNLSVHDIGLYEINEAFASQAIAIIDLLKINPQTVNIRGGSIALGHPLGASGARILTTLIYALKQTKKRYGVASLCVGGGQGISVLVENI